MKPTCPLYFDPADVMAAFSRDCDPDVPAGPSRFDRRSSSATRLAAALAGSMARLQRRVARRLAHPVRGRRMPGRGRSRVEACEPVVAYALADPRTADRFRSGLISHYALSAPGE